MTDLLGITIQNYLLEKQIGSGQLTQVYFAHNYRSQKSAACKIAQADATSLPLTRQLLAQETAVNQQLVHPHILPIEAHGELALDELEFTLPYLITPFMAGGSVAMYRNRLAQQRQKIPVASAVKLAYLVASALAAAHAQNVLHLDIKPENLLLQVPGNLATVMVADFGAQLLLTGDQQVQSLMGTPAYMAPEQIAGQSPDARTDIFALGVVLYELIAGKRPFPGETLASIYPQQQLPLNLAAAPASLQPILQQALAFSPAERYPTASALAEALHRWQLEYQPHGENGRIPQPGAPHQTRLIATAWLPPTNQTRGIDYSQNWHEGAFRFYIAHPNGRIEIQTISELTRILEIGRPPTSSAANGRTQSPEIRHIPLPDMYVSELHATVERVGNGWQIIDNNSTNGTFLDGELIEAKRPTYWRGRTLARIGPYILAWEAREKYALSAAQADEAYRRDEEHWRKLAETQFWLTPRSEQFLRVAVLPEGPLKLAPGETAELTVILSSLSPVIERVEIVIEELPPPWFTIPPIDFAPVAGLNQTVIIQIHPPHRQAPAGTHAASLVVYSARTGQMQFKQPLYVEISPVQGELYDLHPKNVKGEGQTRLTIWNTGNQPASYLVLARDPANGLHLDPPQQTVVVPPGQQAAHLVKIESLERRPLLPPSRQIPYELRVGRSETSLQTINGQLELKPILAWWLPLVILLLIALLVFLVPRMLSRSQAGSEMVETGQKNLTAAEATQISAQATIVISQELLGNLDPEADETPNAEVQQVQANLAAAQADLASAEAAATAAAGAIDDGQAVGPIGPAIPPAQPPTAVLLDNTTIAEDAPAGTAVGLLISEDPNDSETHTYRLVSGEGDADNGLFSIVGSQLLLQGSLDFETQPMLSLRVQSQDSRGEIFAQRLAVSVEDSNEPFTIIALNNDMVPENTLSAIVGDLTAVDDPDKNDSHTFTLVDDPTGLLEISGPSLRVKTGQSLNYEEWPDGIPLEISAVDGGEHTISQSITVQIEDKNDPPELAGFGHGAVEDQPLEIQLEEFIRACEDEDEPEKVCQLTKIRISQLPSNGFLLLVPRNFVYNPIVPLEPDQNVYEGREIPIAPFQKLLYVPDRNFNGRVQFRWNGFDGEDYAAQDTAVTITLTPANDPPTFVADSNIYTVDEDAGQQNFNWATDIRYEDGNPNDLRFIVCSNSNPGLFSSGPRVSAGGNLIFTPAEHKNGRADLTLLLTNLPFESTAVDQQICSNPENPKTALTIIVEPINDAPILNCNGTTLTTRNEGALLSNPLEVRGIVDALGSDCITELDGGFPLRWIAVIGVSPPGAWQYRLTGSDSWRQFPADLSNTAAVLLNGLANLATAENFYGTATITFRIWDGTVGQNGDTNINIIEFGGETAFSSRSVTVTQPVTAVNDQPVINLPTTTVACENNTIARPGNGGTISDADDLGDGNFSFNEGSLTIALATSFVLGEVIRIDPGETAQAAITISGAAILFNGNSIGSFRLTTNSLDINFTTVEATSLAASTLLQRIVYDGPNCNIFLGQSFSINLDFDDGGNSNISTNNSTSATIMIQPN